MYTYSKLSILLILVISLGFLVSCSDTGNKTEPDKDENYLVVPGHFPPVPQPEDNPITKEKVKLGRMLFYEKLLSRNKEIPSCSHCMSQQHAFSDDQAISKGIDNEPEPRNAMSLVNAAYRDKLFWDGRGSAIESPAYRSIWLPMILDADTNEVQKRLENHPEYPRLFKEAFGEDAKPTAYLASKAIASFVRTFISGNSTYDRYINGDSSALSDSQLRGKELFFSERTQCATCHSGIFFTDLKFHNTGTTTHYFDKGRFYITDKVLDWGKFITPTLRNVEVSGPYMHNGELETLEDVIDHYSRGGYEFYTKSPLMDSLNFTDQEKDDLIAFLKSLTDHEFLNNPKFSNPHVK